MNSDQNDEKNPLDHAIERVKAIHVRDESERDVSHRKLIHEYFRRMALWSSALNDDGSWPHLDIPTAVGPVPETASAKVLSFQNWLNETSFSRSQRELLARYVHFIAIKPLLRGRMATLPCPYEPLVRLYERGGGFYFHHGTVEVTTGSSISLHRRDIEVEREPFLGLDDIALDALDFKRL